MIMRRRLACCTRDTRDDSIDFDEQERVMTYNGLESCILNSQSYDNESGTSRGDGCVTDFFDEDLDSSCSSSTNAFSSFSSLWTVMKKDDNLQDDCASSATPKRFDVVRTKEKPDNYNNAAARFSDVEIMKEKFAKLLLGEDTSGGTKGVSTSVALSNAITSLAASVFGELWKLEPLPEERKKRWRNEMDWLLSPTNYMIELVPTKQNGSNGRTLEIMTPKARADVNMILPALRKLDSMLIETLDSMVGNEFWYSEIGSTEEGRNKNGGESRRWWLPSPRVPKLGLSDFERKKLLNQGKVVYQVFKAAKSINENVLAEMPVPSIIKDALPKSGKASLDEKLYKVLTSESLLSAEEMINCLNVKSEHKVLEAINKIELAMFTWKEKMLQKNSVKSPVRTSWSFMKDPLLELDKTEALINQAEVLRQQLKSKHPNLPQTFLEATKIKYGKDVGHSILEAYSRVLANLAFRILSRVGDVLQEDVISNPNSPVAISRLVGVKIPGISDSPMLDRVRHSLIHQLNRVENGQSCNHLKPNAASYVETIQHEESKISSSICITPSRSRVFCLGKKACRSVSAQNSP